MENALAFSKGGGRRWETGAKRPSRDAMAVFHGCPRPGISTALRVRKLQAEGASGAELGDARQQLALGALHIERGFGIGLQLREAFQFGEGDTGTE